MSQHEFEMLLYVARERWFVVRVHAYGLVPMAVALFVLMGA